MNIVFVGTLIGIGFGVYLNWTLKNWNAVTWACMAFLWCLIAWNYRRIATRYEEWIRRHR